MDEGVNLVLLLACIVLLVSVVAVRLSSRTGLPVLLVYLAVGLVVGEAGLGFEFTDYQLTADLGLIALAIILAEGGLTTRWSTIRPVLPHALVLATLGVGVTVGVVAAAGHLLLGLDLRTAVILGAVIGSTDASAVFSVLRRLPLRSRVAATLEGESGLNDAPVAVLVVLASSDAWASTSLWAGLGGVAFQLLAGALLGLVFGRLGRELLMRVALPSAGLYPLATLAIVLLAYSGTTALGASGFMAAYLSGLVLGNSRLPHQRSVFGFVGSLALMAEVGLYVLLGLLASPARLPDAVPLALVIGLVLVLVARPLAVLVSLVPLRVPWREVGFVSWAGLRGAVPIVLTTIPITQRVPEAERVLDVVFVLVVVYTIAQAPTLPLAGRLLRVVEPAQVRDLEVEAAPLEDLRADLVRVTVGPGSRLHGVYVDELRLPAGAQVTLIVREGKSFVPGPHSHLLTGDSALIVVPSELRAEAEDRLRAVAKGGKLARWLGEA
ncbi:MAG TPA: potassium/proton antiporter [Mycobacteriales bacterium]|nr:potassium/proton antiporter [Mycobacteriales bacterium]